MSKHTGKPHFFRSACFISNSADADVMDINREPADHFYYSGANGNGPKYPSHTTDVCSLLGAVDGCTPLLLFSLSIQCITKQLNLSQAIARFHAMNAHVTKAADYSLKI